MNDLISRQAALDALGDEPEVWTDKDEYAMGLNNQWHYDKNAILKCPSAQPRKGKWVRANTHTDGVYECSACLQWTYIPFHPSNYNYCPRCGSDMRGDDDEI